MFCLKVYLTTLALCVPCLNQKPNDALCMTTLPFVPIRQNDITIFVGYAPEDAEQSEKLRQQLSFFKKRMRRLPVDIIDESSLLQADVDRLLVLQQALDRSEIILLLISDTYVNSDFYYQNELLPALDLYKQGKAHVLPIILDFCLWDELPFENLAILPDPDQITADRKRPIMSNGWQSETEPYFLIAKYIREMVADLEKNDTPPAVGALAGAEPDFESLPPPPKPPTAASPSITPAWQPPLNEQSETTANTDDQDDDAAIKEANFSVLPQYHSPIPYPDTSELDMQKTDRLRSLSAAVLPADYALEQSPLTQQYDYNQGIAVGVRDGNWVFWDTQGQLVSPERYDQGVETQHQIARVRQNGKWGWIDQHGNEIVPPQYDDTRTFADKRAKVRRGDLWGWIDPQGNEVIPTQYETTYNFADGLALVKQQGKWGWIDLNGNVMIPLQYETAYLFDKGMALVELNNKWGWIDPQGNTLIAFEYDYAHDFTDNRALVMQQQRWGFIDRQGKLAIALQYADAQWFEDGLAEVATDDERFLIDTDGNRIETIE